MLVLAVVAALYGHVLHPNRGRHQQSRDNLTFKPKGFYTYSNLAVRVALDSKLDDERSAALRMAAKAIHRL